MYKKELKDVFEIVDYMKTYSLFSEGYFLDEARIIDDFSDCKAQLISIDISELRPKQSIKEIHTYKLEHYSNLNIEKTPPIIIKENTIIDGHHRYYLHLNLKKDKILAYQLIEIF